MAITKNNFSLNQNYELFGHEVTLLVVDFINTMASEVNDCSDGTALGGLDLVRKTFEQQGVTILAEGPLVDSGTQKNYIVRADSLDTLSSTTTVAALETALQALDQSSDDFPNITADLTGAQVATSEMGILTAAIV
jgi:hypothetical protein|tara:strand:- start:668 stop:1075 length:408 start_codon:yes stop_codon:yes gene_type:complete